jgi:hypothetical protein
VDSCDLCWDHRYRQLPLLQDFACSAKQPKRRSEIDSAASQQKDAAMIAFIHWFIPALIGVQFTLLGSLKLYGLCRGIVGGADKPLVTKLCGT